MESVNGTVKVEYAQDTQLKTHEQARRAIVVGLREPGRIRAALTRRVGQPNANAVRAKGSTALRAAGRFRFVASDRTGLPWITLFVILGVHVTVSGSIPCRFCCGLTISKENDQTDFRRRDAASPAKPTPKRSRLVGSGISPWGGTTEVPLILSRYK